jgi:hypothetical protein
MSGECGANGREEDARRLLVRKSEVKRSLGRSRLRWVNNIEMDFAEIGWNGVD